MIKSYFDAIPRRVLMLAAGANVLVTAGVVVASVLATPIYRSEAMLIPKSAFSSSPLDLAGGAQSALMGLGLGGGNSKLTPFEAILKSPAVTDRFIASSGLKDAVKRDYIEDYRDLTSNIMLIDFRKDGTIAVAAEDKSPQVAQKYAKAYVAAFESVAAEIAERTANGQASALNSIVERARSNYGQTVERASHARVDTSLVRQDPGALSAALRDIESKLLASRIKLAELERTLTPNNPAMAAARTAHQQLLDAQEQLLNSAPKADSNSTEFSLQTALARQSAAVVGYYTQAREKVMVDAMMASSPYTVAQEPTLPQKRIRPQRRRMISFGIMVQGLLTCAALGVYATLRRRRAAGVNA
jgi:capsular polysaccharide biosynthesis protein